MDSFRSRHFGLRHMCSWGLLVRDFSAITPIQFAMARQAECDAEAVGFLPVNSGETAETEFLRKLPLAGKVVYDVGAFEGAAYRPFGGCVR